VHVRAQLRVIGVKQQTGVFSRHRGGPGAGGVIFAFPPP
jgi:hypothetical protein